MQIYIHSFDEVPTYLNSWWFKDVKKEIPKYERIPRSDLTSDLRCKPTSDLRCDLTFAIFEYRHS